jgi:hypothetical protein
MVKKGKRIIKIQKIQPLIEKIVESGRYLAVLHCGNYLGQRDTAFSDVDLYAIGSKSVMSNWYAETYNNVRVELSVKSYDEWVDILGAPYSPHAKHHYSFVNGHVLFESENLLKNLRELARQTLSTWPKPDPLVERKRYELVINRDKFLGYQQREMFNHCRFLTSGTVFLVCETLVRYLDGYSVDGGKNLDRILSSEKVPDKVKELILSLLSRGNDADLHLIADELTSLVHELTGGTVTSLNGGIPL